MTKSNYDGLDELGLLQKVRRKAESDMVYTLSTQEWKRAYPQDKDLLAVRKRIREHGITVTLDRSLERDTVMLLVFRQEYFFNDDADVRTADGGAVCAACGYAYREHPVGQMPVQATHIRVLCDGLLVKL